MTARAPEAKQGEETKQTRPVAFRGGGFVPSAGRYSGWIALAVVVALWQLAGSAGWVNPLFLPPPSAIAVALWKLAMSGALWQHVSWSIMRIGSGWIIGTAAGVLVGFAIGLSTLARSVGITFISALFPIPENRAAAASDPLARDRRGTEDRNHCARRVLLDRDLRL